MNARYHDLAFDETTRTLTFEMENVSGEAWRTSDGFRVGYQVFDAASEIFLAEGDRGDLGHDVKVGARAAVSVTIALPDEPALYRVFWSPIVEGQGWAYETGLPFVVMDLLLGAGNAVRLKRLGVTDLARRRRVRLARAVPRALVMPFQTVWNHRRLSYTLTKREILSRSRGSFGGALWTVLNPLLLMATYFFVFGLVLKSRFEDDPRPSSFALYFLAGMLPWLAFSEAAGRAPTLLIEYRQLIRKLVFPIEMLPVNLVFSGLVGEAFGLGLFVVALILLRGRLPWTLIYLPLLLIPQMIFTVGMCWFLSALGAFLRDLAQVNGFLLTLWFFITPICYPQSQIPVEAGALLKRNPIFILVNGYRAILLQDRAPDWKPLLGLTAVSLALAIAAHAWFYRLKKSFADVL